MTDKQLKLLILCNGKYRTVKYLCEKLKVDHDLINHIISDKECNDCLMIKQGETIGQYEIQTNHVGETLVHNAKKENFALFYPNVVSTLALVLSLIALICSIWIK